MKVKAFIDIVELRTKVASFIPFIGTLGYIIYSKIQINYINIIIFLIAMLLVDMSTTALNHYRGIAKEKDINKYDEDLIKTLKNHNWSKKTILAMLISMITIALFLSLYLVINSNYYVLILGIYCVLVAFFYSYGPIPICTTLLGEFFSGVTMGIIIPLLLILVNFNNDVLIIDLKQGINLIFDLKYFVKSFLISIPYALCIANILLANNICDIKKDFQNKRYTLAVQLGTKKGSYLMFIMYLSVYFLIAFLIVLKILPIYFFGMVITLIPVMNNIKKFNEKKIKEISFIYSVKNFLIICGTYAIIFIVLGILKI